MKTGFWPQTKNGGFMNKKITWNMINKDFRAKHPEMRRSVTYWRPYNFATILLYFKDGRLATYDYDKHKLRFLKERWIKD